MRRITEEEHSILAGVCTGMAYAFRMPTILIRFFWALAFICDPTLAIGFYFFLWLFTPAYKETPKDYEKICEFDY